MPQFGVGLQQLAETWPQFPEYRHVLAVFHENRGIAYDARGLSDKAEQEFLEAIRIIEPLAETHASAVDYGISLGEICGDLGDVARLAFKASMRLMNGAGS
jgi:hypothetical protein